MTFPVSPSNGTITVVNSKTYQYLTSKNAWVVIRTIGLPGQFTTREYTANGVSNTFTITSGFTANSLIVTENGVLQSPISDYTVSGDTLTFVTTPANTTLIQIRELQITGQAGATGPAGASTPNAISDQVNTSTGYLSLPSGNTAQRPGSVANGFIRYNTTTFALESYLNGSWITIASNELFSYTPNVECLVVAGGGAGGGTSDSCAGGGGAGGLLYGTSISVSSGTIYTITIGAGAAGSGLVGANGSNSSVAGGALTMTALGGGGGAGGARGSFTNNGLNGGSGGGGGAFPSSSGSGGTKTQGNSGGATGYGNNGGATASTTQPGGGGGAGTAGNTASQGRGGDGLQYDISGVNTYYAGGGGASYTGLTGGLGGGGNGAPSSQGNGGNGTTNTGGGGGGSYGYNTGGSGGSGIVIIRYANTYANATSTTGSPTYSDVGGYKIYKFTSSGSITF